MRRKSLDFCGHWEDRISSKWNNIPSLQNESSCPTCFSSCPAKHQTWYRRSQTSPYCLTWGYMRPHNCFKFWHGSGSVWVDLRVEIHPGQPLTRPLTSDLPDIKVYTGCKWLSDLVNIFRKTRHQIKDFISSKLETTSFCPHGSFLLLVQISSRSRWTGGTNKLLV